MQPETIIDLLAYQAQAYRDNLFVRFLKRGKPAITYTYGQAWEWATRWAAALLERELSRGEIVIIALPNTDDFIGAYFGVLLAGGIPAPAAPLRRLVDNDVYLTRIAQRIEFTSARILIVPEEQSNVKDLAPLASLKPLSIVSRRDLPETWRSIHPASNQGDLGLIQFTSGTSGKAKGVELSHAALLTQTQSIAATLQVDASRDWGVSFLPLFHDMGLIGYLLTPLYAHAHVTLLHTEDFLLAPSTWIKALSDYRATITGGPPSAYALCSRHIKPAEVEKYDLSQVRVALVGAEMISPDSLRQFAERFQLAGFRATSLLPTYGLAENGLAVSMTPLDLGPEFEVVDIKTMQATGRAEKAFESNDRSTRVFASVGIPLVNTSIVIANETGKNLADRQVGNILVKSPSLMRGYFRQPETSQQALRGGWLWTGDLGYLDNGKLYITGRAKEILIVGGRNYYPDDLEQVASVIAGVRNGRVVAISVEDPEQSTESVIILAETTLKDPTERDELRQGIRRALVQSGFPVGQVVLLAPKTIQITPSGKIQRVDCKVRYLAGEFSTPLELRGIEAEQDGL